MSNPYADLVESNPYEALIEKPAEPSIGERAGRVAGLGARAVVQGTLGLPVLLGDALNQAYNKVTGSNRASVQEGFQSFLNNAGLPEPQNLTERLSTGVTSAMTGLGTQFAAGQAPGAVAALLRSNPGLQTAAAVTGPVAAQTAAEMGAGPMGQMAAGMAGGAAPFARPMATGPQSLTPAQETAIAGRRAGLVVPPSQVNPTVVNQALEGLVSGKVQTAQHASVKNQPRINRLVAEDLGLPKGTVLSDSVLENVRSGAGKAYGRIKMLPLKFKPDQQFADDVANLSGDYAAAVKEFPKTTGSVGVQELQDDLLNARLISPPAAIEKIKDLRFQASKNYKAFDNPEKAALASAQKQAANALEELVERRLQQSGKTDLVDNFRQARTLIAKTYDAEAALNDATGNVNARLLARQSDKHPMGGGMGQAARFAKTFEKAVQTPEQMGSTLPWSPLDTVHGSLLGMGGMYGAGSGWGALAGLAAPASRSIVRAGILSSPFQNSMMSSAQNLTREQAAALAALGALRGTSQ